MIEKFENQSRRLYRLLQLGARYDIVRHEMNRLDEAFTSLTAEERLQMSAVGLGDRRNDETWQ